MTGKICFTIMGFGKKTDYSTGKTYDLDKTYFNIIKPVVESCGYTSIRADEIHDSGLIDKSMYALLIRAELVIADITTLNPNALYELGIRHAARPNFTVILKNEDGNIPFDLDHTRFLIYKHLGEDIGVTAAQECKQRLQKIIESIESQRGIDSPLFEYIHGLNPHQLSEEDYRGIITKLLEKENNTFALTEQAKSFMVSNDFMNAAITWAKASTLMPEEIYFVQQQALCTYKSDYPSKDVALLNALTIISPIYVRTETNDPETLGLVGAIYKRLYESNNDVETIKLAIEAYERGFKLSHNYYTGENYATCLELLAEGSDDPEEISYCKFSAKKARGEIISIINRLLLDDSSEQDKKWMYATLANCYFNLGEIEKGNKCEKDFLNEMPLEWEKKTYYSHKPI